MHDIVTDICLRHDAGPTSRRIQMAENSRSPNFFEAFIRPAWVVMMVAQMLLGLALALTLIMKYYMLVFGAVGCVGDDQSIANLVRCTPTMELVAQFLIGVAAFRVAAYMFSDTPLALLQPLAVGLIGLFLFFMTGVVPATVSWSMAAVILTFVGAIAATFAGHVYLHMRKPDA